MVAEMDADEPQIRNASADALLVVTEDKELLRVDWSKPVKALKGIVDELSMNLGL